MKFIIVDTLIIVLSFFLAYALRGFLPLPPIQSIFFYYDFLGMSIVLFLAAFWLHHLYARRLELLSLRYLEHFLRALFLWFVLLAAFAFFTKTDYSRLVVVLFFSLTVAALYFARVFTVWMKPELQGIKSDKDIKSVIAEIARHAKESPLSDTFKGLDVREEQRVWQGTLVRVFDIVGALNGLFITVLIFPIVAVLIKKDSAGPVLVSQKRIGKDGRSFTLYKFRTMHNGTELYAYAPRAGADSRITRVGRFLRKSSIDEMPQFWNVLKGEMSIVGPRPEMPFIVENYEPWQRVRLEVKPGITGLWQIFGRKDLPLHLHLEHDIYYVFNRSFFFDLAIILKTFPHLIVPRGAY
jgi:lipopolysaccharide/colanic/teichoic acid biosynthesis glycosyltransferase